MDKSREILPNEVSSYDYIALLMAENYLKLGKPEIAKEMMPDLAQIRKELGL